jgi:hypothetical protein
MDDDAADRIEAALGRVETAIKDKWTTVQWVGIMVIGAFLWSLPGTIWHAKWRYGGLHRDFRVCAYREPRPPLIPHVAVAELADSMVLSTHPFHRRSSGLKT